MIRDGLKWAPWWIRYAEHDGWRLLLTDHAQYSSPHRECITGAAGWHRYDVVAVAPDDPRTPAPCPRCGSKMIESWPGTLRYLTDDLDCAIAVFHEYEEKLLRGNYER